MSEPHPSTQYDAEMPVDAKMFYLMQFDQVEKLVDLIEQVKAHGWGEIEIVVRDHRVTLFRVTENHK